jgi:hypothetical protein
MSNRVLQVLKGCFYRNMIFKDTFLMVSHANIVLNAHKNKKSCLSVFKMAPGFGLDFGDLILYIVLPNPSVTTTLEPLFLFHL